MTKPNSYADYVDNDAIAPRELATHFATYGNAIQHNTDKIHEKTGVPKFIASIFAAAFEIGVMVGGAPTESCKKEDLLVGLDDVDTFDPKDYVIASSDKNLENLETAEHKKETRNYVNRFYKAAGQLLMAVAVNSFTRAHVVAPSKSGDFSVASANSEITTKARAAIRMAADFLFQLQKAVRDKEFFKDESRSAVYRRARADAGGARGEREQESDGSSIVDPKRNAHTDTRIQLNPDGDLVFYDLSKSLCRRSLAYKQVLKLRLKEGRLKDLHRFYIPGWKVSELEEGEGQCYVQCRCYLPLNDESKNRIKDGPYHLKTGLRAAKEIAASAPIGGLLIPSVKGAVAGYTAALETSALDPFITIPGVTEEQPGNSMAANFMTVLADATMRAATRKLQSLHAGLIEGKTGKVSLFQAVEDHPELAKLGVAIGTQLAVSTDDLPKVKEFLKKVKKRIGAETEELPEFTDENEMSEISGRSEQVW